MSVVPPNSWLRDKMIEFTNKTLDIINNTEATLNDRIDNLNEKISIKNNNINNISVTSNVSNNEILNNSLISNFDNLLIAYDINNNNNLYTNSINSKRHIIQIPVISNEINNSNYTITINKNEPNRMYIKYFQFINQNTNNNSIELLNSGIENLLSIYSTPNTSIEYLKQYANYYTLYILDNTIKTIYGNEIEIQKIIGYRNRKNILSIDKTTIPGTIIINFNENIIDVNSFIEDSLIINCTIVLVQDIHFGDELLVIGNTNITTNIIGNNINIGNSNTNINGNIIISGDSLIITSNNVNIIHESKNHVTQFSNLNITSNLYVPNIFTNFIDFKTTTLKSYWINDDPYTYKISIKSDNIIELAITYGSITIDPKFKLLNDLSLNYLTDIINKEIFLTDVTAISGTFNSNPLPEQSHYNIIGAELTNIGGLMKIVIRVEPNNLKASSRIYNGIINIIDKSQNRQIIIPSRVAFGGNTQANGLNSISSGGNTQANGLNSISCGGNTQANGNNSIVSGFNNFSSGHESFVTGYSNNCEGNNSIVSGSSNTCTGNVSIVSGSSNICMGNGSIVSGSSNTCTGNVSIVSGSSNICMGNGSIVSGDANNCEGHYSIVSGYANTGTGNCSIVSGYKNITYENNHSITCGDGLINIVNDSLIVGHFNDPQETPSIQQHRTNFISSILNFTNNTVTGLLSGNPSHGWDTFKNSIDAISAASSREQDILFSVGTGSSNSHRKNAISVFSSGIINTAHGITKESDINLKSNIQDISGYIAKNIIKDIEIKNFNKHNGLFITDICGNLINTMGPNNSIGIIAQNTHTILSGYDSKYNFLGTQELKNFSDISNVQFIDNFNSLPNSRNANTLYLTNNTIYDNSFGITTIDGNFYNNNNISANQTINDVSSGYVYRYNNISYDSLFSLSISALQEVIRDIDKIKDYLGIA